MPISASDELRWLEYGSALQRRARNVLSGPATRHTGRLIRSARMRGAHRRLESDGIRSAQPPISISLDLERPASTGRERTRSSTGLDLRARPSCITRSGATELECHPGPASRARTEAARYRSVLGRGLLARWPRKPNARHTGCIARISPISSDESRARRTPRTTSLPIRARDHGRVRVCTHDSAQGARRLAQAGLIVRRAAKGHSSPKTRIHAVVMEIPDIQAA